MDALQQQITELDRKINGLHSSIEQLGARISALALEKQPSLESEIVYFPNKTQGRSQTPLNNGRLKAIAEHKDILIDGSEGQSSYHGEGETTLSSEIQIRRLTAQLTAAYNRIAALEEQLLACRMSS
jgi:hypothetical protein